MTTPSVRGLRRQIGFLGTISLSVGVMAPTLAMSLTGVQASGLIGRAAPLAFVFAAIGVAFVAYGFVRLSSHFSHAGSVYAFTGLSLGPRAGFFSGWALLGTYIVFPPVSIMGIAIFGQAFLRSTGIASSPPWWPLALAGWAVIGLLASRGARTTTRSLLTVALVVAIAFGSVFYIVCMTAQTLGFGTDAAGIHAFSHSGAPLGDLGRSYVGSAMADVLDLVAVLSAVGAGLGCASVGTRMLFALGRDGILSRDLAGVAASTGTPAAALAAELTLSLCAIVGFAIAGTPAINVFFYLATMGILSLLVMYVVTNLGALRYLFLGEQRRVALWEIVFPIGGIGFAVYTLYKNVWPVPPYPFEIFPYVVAGWLAVGLAAPFLVPGFATRVQGAPHSRADSDDETPAAIPAWQ